MKSDMDFFGWIVVTLVVGHIVLFAAEFFNKDFRKDFHNKKRLRRNLVYLMWSFILVFLINFTNPYIQGISLEIVKIEVLFVEIILVFAISELLYYWIHVLKHKSIFVWNFHFPHHLEKRYNIWLASHEHVLGVYIPSMISASVQTIMGFSKESVLVFSTFFILATIYQHSSNNYTLGFLDKIIISPAYHRYHHYINYECNYGNVLTIYDVLFQTDVWPKKYNEKPLEYGIDSQMPYGFAKEQLYFLEKK